jgi:hypothetical protein
LASSSFSDPDPHSKAAWNLIRIPNSDPDPGSVKRAEKERKNESKRQVIRLNICLLKVYGMFFNVLPGSGSAWFSIHFENWMRICLKNYPDPHKVNADPKHWQVDLKIC